MWSFLTSLVFASIIAGAFFPIFHYLVDKKQMNRTYAASIVCFLIVLVIFIPGTYITIQLSKELVVFYEGLKSGITEKTLNDLFFGDHFFATTVASTFDLLNQEYNLDSIKKLITSGLSKVSLTALNSVNALVGNIFSFFFQFFVMLVAIFAIFRDGRAMMKFFLDLSPLQNDDERLIIKQFNTMNYVTLVSNGIGGFIQGILAGIGFFLAGVPSLLLWTILMIVLAFIPLLGMSLVYIPVCIYLYFSGAVWQSVTLFIYCSVIALIVENWFKPRFIGDKVEINPILVFFSIIGGMSVFGMSGIFYGPLIVSIFLTVSSLYLSKYEGLILNNREFYVSQDPSGSKQEDTKKAE
ncbi:MAG: AI-2E family transporter, partial [Spirochaetota bacterium]